MTAENIGLVRFKLDPKNPPTMTDEQLQRLREMRDEDTDYRDIPPVEDTTG